MAVALDVAGSEDQANAATSPRTYAGLTTAGSLSNGAIVCMFSFSSAAPGITSVTWGTTTPQTMTLIKSQTATNQSVHVYGLIGVTKFGAQNLTLTWTGGTLNIIGMAASFTGVDQTGGATSFPNSNSATATNSSPAVTITSATGNAVMAIFCNLSAGYSATNNTTLYTENGLSSINGAASRAAGAASVSCTATAGGSDTWTAAGTDIAAVGAGGGAAPFGQTNWPVSAGALGMRPQTTVQGTSAMAMPATQGLPLMGAICM